jgi:threonylcarbamoyladenosine tRNA methylthiotransferase MtaB
MKPPLRFAIGTLGCKVNQYDSSVIESRLAALNFERCEFDEPADVYIVNTCTITDRADSEGLRLVRRARRRNPQARVIVTGCLAQAHPESLAAHPDVDAVVGLGRLDDLERAVSGEEGPRVRVSNLRKIRAPMELAATAPAGHTRAFLKIQEGCDQFCTYCIVPFSRGASRSVEPRRIIETIEAMYAGGMREVVLSGVHLGGFGKDLVPSVTIEYLLEMLAERSPIRRIRLSSLDPEELSDDLIEIIASNDCFCPHLHLPLQSGEDSTLARMRRRYDTGFFKQRVERVIERLPDAAIGTDLIVGFPGEDAANFESYFKFVEALPLAYFHVFPYSARQGTTAAKFSGDVNSSEIYRRAAIMRRLGEQKKAAFSARFARVKLKVLLERRENRIVHGLSRNYIRVTAPCVGELCREEVEFQATHVEGTTLVGTLVRSGPEHYPAALQAAGRRA